MSKKSIKTTASVASKPAIGSENHPDKRPIDRKGIRGPKAEKTISLALQGGGAHGAFTWGVLDALLADGRFAIEAISGTSAGAMNGVVMLEGFLEGGISGARAQLKEFWQKISVGGSYSPLQRSLLNKMMSPMGQWPIEQTLGFWWLEAWSRALSPYESNPLNINPLQDVLEELIDFEKVRASQEAFLYIAATNVRSGKIKIFEEHELTAKHLMASACLPTLFQAVEIGDDAYWDGGYMGNPALYPLFYEPRTEDVVLVQINPVARAEVPITARDIQNRLTEITFNATLLREMRAVKFVTDLIDSGTLPQDGSHKRVKMHRIDGGEALKAITASSRISTDWEFLENLRDQGRLAAKNWIKSHYEAIGHHATLDLTEALA